MNTTDLTPDLFNKELNTELFLHHPMVAKVRAVADPLGADLYLVGGALRDGLRTGALPPDLDFMVLSDSTERKAKQVALQIAQDPDARYVLLDEAFGIHRVVWVDGSGFVLDFSDGLENSLEKDLARRDVTVNALGLNLKTGTWHDPFNGRADLSARHIRMVSEQNLVEDPLRLLRVFRIGAHLQASLESETLDAVRHHAPKLLSVAPERIQYEFLKLLSVEPCFPYINAMAETGLLEVLLPELTAAHEIPPNGYHHLNLFDHTLEVLHQSEQLLSEFPAFDALRQEVRPGVTHMALIKFAALLHDVGKPATKAVRDDGRFTYYGHDQVSATMTDAVAERLRLSRDVTGMIKKLVRWHLYPCHFKPDSSRKALLRFYRRMGEETPAVILLALADRYSTRGAPLTPADLQTSHDNHLWLLARYETERVVFTQPPLLTGTQVMQTLNLSPGPQVGKVMRALEEQQQLGNLTTEAEALAWLKDKGYKP